MTEAVVDACATASAQLGGPKLLDLTVFAAFEEPGQEVMQLLEFDAARAFDM